MTMPMIPAPADWPLLSSALVYGEAAAVDWQCRAPGFAVRFKIKDDDGRVLHSDLTYGEAVIMIAQERGDASVDSWKAMLKSSQSLLGGNSRSIILYVDDADAHGEQGRASGATIADAPSTHDDGAEHWADRGDSAVDIEGHIWWIIQRLRYASALQKP